MGNTCKCITQKIDKCKQRNKFNKFYLDVSNKGFDANNLVLNEDGIVDISHPSAPKILLKKRTNAQEQEYY